MVSTRNNIKNTPTKNEQASEAQIRLLWQCRRGMLELDLLLIPFAKEYYAHLPDNQKEDFKALLHYPDPVIFSWLMGSISPNEPELIKIVQLIREHYMSASF